MARLRLALLGSLHVTLDGQPIHSFGYDKVRALLAYLAIESQRPHDRSHLAMLLWPGEPIGIARKNLRTALATLRQAIGDTMAMPPFLLISRDTIQFNSAGDYELDVTVFTTLLTEVERHAHESATHCDICVEKLMRAVDLYRGAFLQQMSVSASVAWEEWALLTRERLHGQQLEALAQLMAAHELCQNDRLARQYAWRALALEAWDEGAHRCLMRVYARDGQRSAALAQYEHCRSVLADELGIEPATETTVLYELLRSGPLERAVGTQQVVSTLPFSKQRVPPMATVSASIPTSHHPLSMLSTGNANASPSAIVQTTLPTLAGRNRRRMLDKVKRFWITGILEQSLHGAALIELGLAHRPEAVPLPWNLLIQQRNRLSRIIPSGTSIADVFDALDGELLILGAPGSGKTTMLLELARTLLNRAEQDSSMPIPVIFNLSSWATQRRSLATWLIDELNLRYQVPRQIGSAWVHDQQILPLLDGLDEVALEYRDACVDAINQFRQQHWLLGMVVCSRSGDYNALTTQLQLNGAVMVQPLNEIQVGTCLST